MPENGLNLLVFLTELNPAIPQINALLKCFHEITIKCALCRWI